MQQGNQNNDSTEQKNAVDTVAEMLLERPKRVLVGEKRKPHANFFGPQMELPIRLNFITKH